MMVLWTLTASDEQWSKPRLVSFFWGGDCTTQLYRDHNKPLQGSPLPDQYNGMLQWFWSLVRCFQMLAGEYLQIYHGFMSVIKYTHFSFWWMYVYILESGVFGVSPKKLFVAIGGFRNGYVSRCSPLGGMVIPRSGSNFEVQFPATG